MTAIARWPDRETRNNASSEKAASARLVMQDCIERTIDVSELEERINLWV